MAVPSASDRGCSGSPSHKAISWRFWEIAHATVFQTVEDGLGVLLAQSGAFLRRFAVRQFLDGIEHG